jgi:hypothetical protein
MLLRDAVCRLRVTPLRLVQMVGGALVEIILAWHFGRLQKAFWSLMKSPASSPASSG